MWCVIHAVFIVAGGAQRTLLPTHMPTASVSSNYSQFPNLYSPGVKPTCPEYPLAAREGLKSRTFREILSFGRLK